MFRHFYASALINEGVEAAVSGALGHSIISTTVSPPNMITPLKAAIYDAEAAVRKTAAFAALHNNFAFSRGVMCDKTVNKI